MMYHPRLLSFVQALAVALQYSLTLFSIAAVSPLCLAQESFSVQSHDSMLINTIALNANGSRMLTHGNDSTIRVWDMGKQKQLQLFSFGPAHYPCLPTFLESSDSFMAIVCKTEFSSDDIAFQLHHCHVNTGKTSVVLSLKITEVPIAFWPEQKVIVLACWNPTPDTKKPYMLKFLEITKQHATEFLWHEPFKVLAYSHDKKLAAVLVDKEIVKIVNLKTGQLQWQFRSRARERNGAIFLPDNRTCITSHWDDSGTLFVWDVEKKQLEGSVRLNIGVSAIGDLTPDGRILGLLAKKRIAFYDTKTRRFEHVPGLHTHEWNALRFLPDGLTYAVGDRNGNIRVLRTPKIAEK